MAHKHIESAPPIHERPQCRWCGKRLKPHYKSHRERNGKTRWRKAKPGDMAKGEPTDPDGDTYSANAEFRRGCWRVGGLAETTLFRKFLGTYGLRDLFCNQSHAIEWAVANARAIERGEKLGGETGTAYRLKGYKDDAKIPEEIS